MCLFCLLIYYRCVESETLITLHSKHMTVLLHLKIFMLPFHVVCTAGEDYTTSSTTVTYSPTFQRHCLTIPVLADAVSEDPESFQVTLITDDPDVTSNVPTAEVMITDQLDTVSVAIERELYRTGEGAGSVEVCVVLTEGELGREITVSLSTSEGSAEGESGCSK